MLQEPDIAYETENFYAVKTPKGFKVFQHGATAATKIGTFELPNDSENLDRVKQFIAGREAKLQNH